MKTLPTTSRRSMALCLVFSIPSAKSWNTEVKTHQLTGACTVSNRWRLVKRKRRRVHEVDSAKINVVQWRSKLVQLSQWNTDAEAHHANQEEPARCWGSFWRLLRDIHSPPQAAFLLTWCFLELLLSASAMQCLSSCSRCAVLSHLRHAFVFECASWSWCGSLIGAHSTPRNKLSFPAPQLSKYCLGNFVIPVCRRQKCLWGCFSSLLLMLPSFSRCFVHRAFLERSRWSSALFTGGKRAQVGLNTAEFTGWRVLFFFAWLFFQKTRVCIHDFEQCANKTQQLLEEQELPSLLLGEPAAYIMEAHLDSQPLQWNWIGCGWWLHVPTHRRSWLGQGCADQFRAGLLSLHASSEDPFARTGNNRSRKWPTRNLTKGLHVARVNVLDFGSYNFMMTVPRRFLPSQK